MTLTPLSEDPVVERLLAMEASEVVNWVRLRLVAADFAEVLYDKSPPDETVVDWWQAWLMLELAHHGLVPVPPSVDPEEKP